MEEVHGANMDKEDIKALTPSTHHLQEEQVQRRATIERLKG